MDDLNTWRTHVEDRLDAQDKKLDEQNQKLDELLSILRASKMGAAMIKWAAGIGATLIAGWAAWKGVR